MYCHSCPHSEPMQRGDYVSTPWNELPCASCKLSESTFFSIPLDEEHPPTNALYSQFDSQPADDPDDQQGTTKYPVTVVYQFLDGLYSLPPELRDVVCWRHQGLQYKEIARRQGTTTQCADMRHKRAMRMWPALEALFPHKTAKRRCRRPHK